MVGSLLIAVDVLLRTKLFKKNVSKRLAGKGLGYGLAQIGCFALPCPKPYACHDQKNSI